jgi:hypothetical protein
MYSFVFPAMPWARSVSFYEIHLVSGATVSSAIGQVKDLTVLPRANYASAKFETRFG